MDTLLVPDLVIMRRWLEQLGISFFECDACEALHLPHLQNIDGVFDAKVDLIDNVIIFSALSEIRPTGLIPLVADLSQINAATLTVKVFVDIQDDNIPKLIICQSLSAGAGVALCQFSHFLQEAEEQVAQIITEAKENGLLLLNSHDNDDDYSLIQNTTQILH